MTIIRAKHQIHGGLHLPENKAPACDRPISDCSLPGELVLPLNMNLGQPAEPVVLVGEQVKSGQLIAQAVGPVSANLHSPVNGIVSAIEERPMSSRSGMAEMAIVIKVSADQPMPDNATPWQQALKALPDEIVSAIQAAGIIGMGGAGFPTSTKLSASQQANTLLINGAECEPYICCDDRTMREFADEVVGGAFLLARAAHCDWIEIATEDNKPEAISALESVIENLPEHLKLRIKLIVVPTRYPMGGEKQLLEAVTGQQVPSSAYPAELGYLVQNVGTALAVHDQLCKGQPLISRLVTVTGKGVTEPGNYRVLIGTSVRHLLQQAGWQESTTVKLIHGGPMMGYPLADADRPITKTTNCVIAATVEEMPPLATPQPCIRCGKCAEVCPAQLLPQQLYWFSKAEEFDKAESFKLHDCIECGLCAYVCPSHIPLVDYYRFAKAEIRDRDLARAKSERSKEKFDARNERLEQERLEKERIKAEKAKQRAANKNADEAKKEAVAAALARVKAKKAAQKSQQPQQPESEQ